MGKTRRGFILLALVLVFGLAGCASQKVDSESWGFRHVSPEEAAQIIESGEATIVDVRGSVSYDIGHIPGAIDFMYDDNFLENAPSILPDKNATIVVYCDFGGVSKLAAQDLADAGYTNVIEFDGMEVWQGAVESSPADSEN